MWYHMLWRIDELENQNEPCHTGKFKIDKKYSKFVKYFSIIVFSCLMYLENPWSTIKKTFVVGFSLLPDNFKMNFSSKYENTSQISLRLSQGFPNFLQVVNMAFPLDNEWKFYWILRPMWSELIFDLKQINFSLSFPRERVERFKPEQWSFQRCERIHELQR